MRTLFKKEFFKFFTAKQVWLPCIISFSVSVIFAVMLHRKFIKYLNIYHTILEGACIFIALSIFMSVLFTFSRNSLSSCILGFGYMSIAAFDIMHVFFHFKLNLGLDTYFDLSTKFWVLGRLTESIVLLLAVVLNARKLDKPLVPLMTITYTVGMIYTVVKFQKYLPVLLTENGVTKLKTILEYLVVGILIIACFCLRSKLREKNILEYKYIFISIAISIPSELCFSVYSSINSISWTLGHVLKITSYYFLYRGTFISTVIYPYEKLEIEHKKLEEAGEKLRHMHDTLNDVLDALPVGIQKYNSDHKLDYVNSKFEEMMGCDRNDLCGSTARGMLKMFPKVEKEKNRKRNKIQKDEKDTRTILRTFKNIKGEKLKLFIKIQKIKNGTLLIVNDAKKEQELENISLQSQTILNAVSNGILMVDRRNKIVLCNRAAEELFEMGSNEIVGTDINRLNEYVKMELKEHTDSDLVSKDERQFRQIALTSKRGNSKEILEYVAPIHNVDGETIGGICIITDITGVKNEQQKLMQQEKLAMLGQMGAGIVHETRNYLTTIKGCCQLINLITKEESTKKHAENINKNVDEVNRIISEFLFLSKPREPEMLEVSFYDVFQSLKSMIETSSLVKGVDIDISISKEERYVLCDEAQIKQVILNLCKNAIEAMGEKKDGKILVDTGYDELTNEVYISITDNGKGISEDDLKKIGKPFFTTKKNGTGLGLSVCYGIVQKHGGRVEVRSKEGIGTKFTVFLPCMEDGEIEDNELEVDEYAYS